MRRLTYLAVGLLALALGSRALADGVAQVLVAKTLPPATVAVIDPESGTSTGGGSTDVKLAPGDVILFRFKYFPVPDKIVHGLQGYLTEYIPQNTQVVGVRIIDANGVTIPPRWPGLSRHECDGPCSGKFMLTTAGTVDIGSISQLYADTGVFYSTDSRTARIPNNAFVTLQNGTPSGGMSPEPINIISVRGLIGAASPIFSHNVWDWIQVRGWGVGTSPNNGRGPTAFGYGSAVAGPNTYYTYEVTEPMPGVIRFNNVNGPWQRVRTPGALYGTGTAPTLNNGPLQRMAVDTTAGFDLTPATPLSASTKAVRIALGEVRVGEPGTAEIALKVLGTPLDTGMMKDVDCAEVFGGDTSASQSGRAKDPVWSTYLGSPACVYLNLLFDLDVDKNLPKAGELLNYTLHGKNLSINPQTMVQAKLKFDTTDVMFVSADSGGVLTDNCDGDSLGCVVWPAVASLAPSGEYTYHATFSQGGAGHVTNVMFAKYTSMQLPEPGFKVQALNLLREILVPHATLQATSGGVAAGANVGFTGTVSNDGSSIGDIMDVTIVMPAGWKIAMGTSVVLGGATLACSANCTGNTPTYDIGATVFARGESRVLTFTATVAPGETTGLHDVDLYMWANQTAFGGDFETYFPHAATVSVGQVRSDPPVVNCPVSIDATTVSGTTTESSGTVRVYLNGIQRGTPASASGGTWTVGTFGPGSAFGSFYSGLEVRATIQAPGELESPMSAPCFVTPQHACDDGADNDGDGKTDFPIDPGCSSPNDADETDLLPACSDGMDNDGDGLTDFGSDPDCGSASDPSESPAPACMDGFDNDGDGQTDFPADTGCHALNDADETEPPVPGDARARLLVVFDTSGSMNWNVCDMTFTGGDGSQDCAGADVMCSDCGSASCGNTQSDDSRIFKVKRGISDAVAAFGEVEYGLMRFHQTPVGFACPGTNASASSGGWQGGGASPCGGGYNAGDLLVGFSPYNHDDLLQWMDGQTNFSGAGMPPAGLDIELRGSGTTPLAGSLGSALTHLSTVKTADPFGGCRPYRVILVTDGAESCGGDAPAAAGALLGAGYKVSVVGFATPDASTIANLNAIASMGGTGSAILVDDSAALSTAIAGIVSETILVERCNGLDDDCDGLTDEDFPDLGKPCNNGEKGLCLEAGVRICSPDELGTRCNAVPGTPGTESCNGLDDDCDGFIDEAPLDCTTCGGAEICNGLDDDCDGMTDEGIVSVPCGVTVGECKAGTSMCVGGVGSCSGATGPTIEVCDGKDNDCDGVIDGFSEVCYPTMTAGCAYDAGTNKWTCKGVCATGLRACVKVSGPPNMFGPCTGALGPVPEKCDGLDNDCDGVIDNGFDLGGACTNGTGPCAKPGKKICDPKGTGVICDGPPPESLPETCNGLDDDCNGMTDEGPLPGVGIPCGSTVGSCMPGTTKCDKGKIVCEGAGGGSPEVCNGLDDDCDGSVDEDLMPPATECPPPGLPPGKPLIGECRPGKYVCTGTGGWQCKGGLGPTAEVCDGKDNDCDGIIDGTGTCPPAFSCQGGECAPECGIGEFKCPADRTCVDGYCIKNKCAGVKCATGSYCKDGKCIDPCEAAMCPDETVCRAGLCQDCHQLGCMPGEVCGVHKCEPDPCFGVTCGAGEYCKAGGCVKSCVGVTCPSGQTCRDGSCKGDLCSGIACMPGQFCDPGTGECKMNPCDLTPCLPGLRCIPTTGTCEPDPCLATRCVAGEACKLLPDGSTECVGTVPPPRVIGNVGGAGGGGCICGIGAGPSGRDGPPAGALALGLLGGILVRRRARR